MDPLDLADDATSVLTRLRAARAEQEWRCKRRFARSTT